ncbi:hypothetical protein GGF31_005191 [Allomyces arbusculus]|nr:hypothetical protein GGF31_005191 [Allomyces arbusculus]
MDKLWNMEGAEHPAKCSKCSKGTKVTKALQHELDLTMTSTLTNMVSHHDKVLKEHGKSIVHTQEVVE